MSKEPHGITTIKQVVQYPIPERVNVYLIWNGAFQQVLHASAVAGKSKVKCLIRPATGHRANKYLEVEDRSIVILSHEDLLHADVTATVQAARGVANPDYGRHYEAAPGFLGHVAVKESLTYDAIPWVC
jgi:hypothetical protein